MKKRHISFAAAVGDNPLPHTGGDDPEYGLCSNRWGSSGSEFVFRVVRRDYRRNYE